jgi:tetratricopeptide (TPR) repeat protein
LAERRTKLKADPTSAEKRFELRRGYRVLGLICEKANRFEAGVEAFDQVIAAGPIPPESADARVKDERVLINNSLFGRALCLDKLNRLKEAENTRSALNEFNKGMGDPIYLAGLLARIGQTEVAIGMTEERLRSSDTGMDCYNAACVYSLASASKSLSPARKEEFARRAIALLDKAQAAGAFNKPGQVEQAKVDEDLIPLRGRGDFKKRMSQWETDKAKKGK